MLVDEFDLAAALEQQRELVEAPTAPCSMTPLTRNKVIRSPVARRGGEEQVLDRRLRPHRGRCGATKSGGTATA